jgi:CRP-like cAMP-binding protein/CheY-like chemotaxis protein
MKKVLVIEDNKEILENTAELLELSNYTVFTAENGKVGVEKAIIHKPDIILCDIMMPVLDGYGVLHVIQNNEELRDTPFIFLTAKTEQPDIRKGMSLGADDYIVKPYDATDLLNAIDARLKKATHILEKLNTIPYNPGMDTGKILRAFIDERHVDIYKKKQRIYTEGNHPLRLYYVKKGKVKIYKVNEYGKELIVKIAKEKEFFGYVALLENAVYKENANALEDCDIISIPAEEFEVLINSHPELSRKVISMLAGEIAEKEEQLLHIAYNSLRRKVADALLTVHAKYKSESSKFNINLTRENLAAVAGTAPESLIRTLTDFKYEKIIDVNGGKITILNSKKLENMLN